MSFGDQATSALNGNSATCPLVAGNPLVSPPIPLSVDEYQRLLSLEKQLEEFQRIQRSVLEARVAERLRALVEKGQIEEALAQQRKTWEQKHVEALHGRACRPRMSGQILAF